MWSLIGCCSHTKKAPSGAFFMISNFVSIPRMSLLLVSYRNTTILYGHYPIQQQDHLHAREGFKMNIATLMRGVYL